MSTRKRGEEKRRENSSSTAERTADDTPPRSPPQIHRAGGSRDAQEREAAQRGNKGSEAHTRMRGGLSSDVTPRRELAPPSGDAACSIAPNSVRRMDGVFRSAVTDY